MTDIEKIKQLRERTNVSIGTCKKALEASNGDIEKSIEWLRVAGELRAQDIVDRNTTQGAVISYIHPGNGIGVLVQVECETDFVARGEDFLSFCKDVAMHIVASKPEFVSIDEAKISNFALREQALIDMQMAADESMKNKTIPVLEKIREGKLTKRLREVCLLDQPFVKDTTKTVDALRKEIVLKTGENVQIIKFTRYDIKEGRK